MLSINEFLLQISEDIAAIGGGLNLPKLKSEIDDLSEKSNNPELWNNPDSARDLLQKKFATEKTLNDFLEIESEYNNLKELYELDSEDADIKKATEELAEKSHKAKFITLFNQPADSSGAFLFIQAGAGGTEAQDWTMMMSRMYSRWAERHNFKIETIEEHAGEVAGLKSITFQITGLRAYGWLRNEVGVHRLVRISPFNANGIKIVSPQ